MAVNESTKLALDALEETVMWSRVAADAIVEAQGGELTDRVPQWVAFHEHTIDEIHPEGASAFAGCERGASSMTRTMLSRPRISGSAQLRELVDGYGGVDRVCKDFRVAKSLLARYLSGSLEPPYTFMLAIYWQGPYGFSQAFSESHWTHQYNFSKRRVAEERCQKLEQSLKKMRAIVASQLKGDTRALEHGVSGL